MLADAAQAVEGKLYILGGGWSIIGPDPVPTAIALHVKVPWDQANMRHRLVLELLDSDGNPIRLGDEDPQPIMLQSEFEVGRPAGLTRGTPIDFSLALNLAPIPLPPGGRFEWRLTLNGEGHEDWRLPFSTRAAPGRPGG